MGKPSWSTLSKTSGSGNDTFTITAKANTGRSQRTGEVTVTSVEDSNVKKIISITQDGKQEFVIFNTSSVSIGKDGGNVTISGVTNSSKLTFAFTDNMHEVTEDGNNNVDVSKINGVNYTEATLPDSYSAAGASTRNGVAISGDPGSLEEFPFSITINFAANPTMNPLTRNLKVTANGGQTASIACNQANSSPTLNVSPTSLSFAAGGETKTITVTANCNWAVS